jgi:LysM repeat protein
MLKRVDRKVHKVARGESVRTIAKTYGVSEWAIARENGLTGEVFAGEILRLPKEKGNAYIVKAGEDKTLLCGSVERYEKLNGKWLYIGQRVIL